MALLLALAAAYQLCSPSSACTIGEWLYDDSYQPQTGAVCTLTAKYPDGTDFFTASASAGAAGWYYYDASIGATAGVYPANLCCTIGSEHLCLDKTFQVQAAASPSPGLTAAEVWTYSSRSLTSFGDLVANIWGSSIRSLTTFGELVSTNTSSPAPLTYIIQEQEEQRELLEKLVNEPIVSLSLEEGLSIPDLNSKLESGRNLAREIGEKLRNKTVDPADLFALSAAWNTPIVAEINLAADDGNLDRLAGLLDDLLKFFDQTEERYLALEEQKQTLAGILDGWGGGETQLERTIALTKNKALALNQYPGGEKLLEPTKTGEDKKFNLKNLVFNLQALLGLNQLLLAANPGDPLRSLWLEEGSVIFRAVATNPSTVISQTVPLKFYLPRELKSENIISLDPALETHYDTTEETLFVTGSFRLSPEETRLVFVEVDDVWQLTDEEINSLKQQAQQLIKPLEKTGYFAQAAVLKSQIDLTLDKARLIQSRAATPEKRIRAYREAQLELNSAKTNLARLQDINSQAAATGSVFGFSSGIQAMSVWGIILIIIAGFVFLALYLKQAKQPPFLSNPAVIPVVILASVIIIVIFTQSAGKPQTSPAPQVLEAEPAAAGPSPALAPKPPEVFIKEEKQVLGEAAPKQLIVPEEGFINVRSGPGKNAPLVMIVKTSLEVYEASRSGGWVNIGFSPDGPAAWWVNGQFLD